MTENQRRKFLKLVGASLATAAGVSILGCKPENTLNAADVPGPAEDKIDTLLPQDRGGKSLSPTRGVLAERLKALAESEPPKDLSLGAMCYVPAPLLKRQISCPDCGEKICDGEKEKILSAYNVPLKRIRDLGVDAKLILPEHCPTCGLGLNACGLTWRQQSELRKSPDEWKRRNFHLEIKYPDDPDFIRVELDEAHDLELMALFLQGKDRWQNKQDMEFALKDKVGRLRVLFGVVTVNREALAERLKALAESELPTDLSPGATCYKPAAPRVGKEPCPVCGETMIPGEKDEIISGYNVPWKRIRDLGVDAKLTIPDLCFTCGHGLKEKKFLLEINYPDDPRPVRVELDEARDLELMALFLQGKESYPGKQGSVSALKYKVDRLRELFGVEEP